MQGFERAKRDSSQAQNDKKQIIKSQPRLHTPSPEATPLFLEGNIHQRDYYHSKWVVKSRSCCYSHQQL